MTTDLARAKEVVLLALERGGSLEDDGSMFRREGFQRTIRSIEDGDPTWLEQHLRDPAYDKTTRTQVATYLTDARANVLLLELMAD